MCGHDHNLQVRREHYLTSSSAEILILTINFSALAAHRVRHSCGLLCVWCGQFYWPVSRPQARCPSWYIQISLGQHSVPRWLWLCQSHTHWDDLHLCGSQWEGSLPANDASQEVSCSPWKPHKENRWKFAWNIPWITVHSAEFAAIIMGSVDEAFFIYANHYILRSFMMHFNVKFMYHLDEWLHGFRWLWNILLWV